MDDFFAALTLACLLLWTLAALARRNAVAGGMRARLADAVLDWRHFFVALAVIAVFRIFLYEMFWIPSASMQPTLREGEFVVVDKRAYGVRAPLVGRRLSEGSAPRRGEIAVFRYPHDEGVFYIKRIVGLPGDRLVLDGNRVSVDGALLDWQGPAAGPYVYQEDNRTGLLTGLWNLVKGDSGSAVHSDLYWEHKTDGWHPILLASSEIAPGAPLDDDACLSIPFLARLECVIPPGSYFVMGDNRHRSNDSRFWGFVPRDNLVGPAVRIAISFDALERFFTPITLTGEPRPVGPHVPDLPPQDDDDSAVSARVS